MYAMHTSFAIDEYFQSGISGVDYADATEVADADNVYADELFQSGISGVADECFAAQTRNLPVNKLSSSALITHLILALPQDWKYSSAYNII